MAEEIKILEVSAPATVANLSCGFDILGLCLNYEADVFTFEKTAKEGIRIVDIKGANLPTNLHENVAGVAGLAIWEQLPKKPDFGIDITINKKMAVGSGLGSSAASAAAMVFGINQMCGNHFEKQDLVFFAMQGEKLVSGQAHADNVAPAIFGGITAVSSYEPFFVKKLPTPNNLFVAIIHPKMVLKTSEARAVLPKHLSYKHASTQMGHLTNFICGLYESNEKLMQLGLRDILVEPYRKSLIPGFNAFQADANKENCLGFGISGAGPSMFALCSNEQMALRIQHHWAKTEKTLGMEANIFISQINQKGVQYKIVK